MRPLSLVLVCGTLASLVGRGVGPLPASEPPAGQPAPTATAAATPSLLVGVFERAAIEAALPDWVAAGAHSTPDAAAAKGLLAVPPGARVLVLFRSSCSDSRREMTRLWKALELAGAALPFELVQVGVDRPKREPAEWVTGRDLRLVPTFIVEREGREVGRIVETSPQGIEKDLLDLLAGAKSGFISASAENESPAP